MAPKNCQHWHELSADDKRAIDETSNSPEFDYPIISVIDGLSREEQEDLYNNLALDPVLCKDYNRLQRRWLQKEREYLALRLNKSLENVSESEFLNDMESQRTCYRYRLYAIGRKLAEGKLTSINTLWNNPSLDTFQLVKEFMDDILSACSQVRNSLPSATISSSSTLVNKYFASTAYGKVYPTVCPLMKDLSFSRSARLARAA